LGNTILLIGNGFDLYHKLPTRYTDFLVFVESWDKFKEIYDSYRSNDGKIIQDGIDSDEQFEVRVDEYGRLTQEAVEDFANHAICYDFEHLQYLNEHLQNNAWIDYFRKTGYKKVGWIDFEREMEKVLLCVEEYYTHELRKHLGKIPNMTLSKSMSSIILWFGNKANAPFCNMNTTLLRQDDIQADVLLNQKLALLDAMKEEMDILNQCLYYYLWDFVSKIKSNIYSEQVEALTGVHLLNFNYTYTYRTIYGKSKITEHHPIHGDLMSNDLVLGISDDSFTDLNYLYFQKYFQRIQKKTGAYYKKWIPSSLETLDYEPAIVHIMGHSLDKTDEGVLKDFFRARYVEKIIIYYHDQRAYENQVINLIDMFGKDFVIDQTADERIEFVKLEDAVYGSVR
jgi:hypothetical protein